jgi:hypothetical protein
MGHVYGLGFWARYWRWLFLRPLNPLFGHASGLRTNLNKSSAFPIQCSVEAVALTEDILSCASKEFPWTYLGLPLSVRKPTRE